jgi:hypothetical protein
VRYQTRPDQTKTRPDQTVRKNGAHEPEISSVKGKGPEGHESLVDSLPYEQAIQAAFPQGPNPPNWTMAIRNARDLVDDGLSTWPDLVAVCERYARYLSAGGASVNIAAHNFFDRRKGNHWQLPWNPPATKAELKRDANIDASLTWLADQEAKDATR